MSPKAAIGIGCRRGVSAADIETAVLATLQAVTLDTPPLLLATIQDKQGEPGLTEAAARLGLVLAFVPQSAMAAVADRTETRSERVIALHNVPSVAEAAALVAAGAGSRLILPRRIISGVTCAVAIGGTS